MELKWYKAAVEGNNDVFVNEPIESILTPNKNTILHIHLTHSEKINEEFVKKILEICPTLVMKSNAKDETILHTAVKYGHFEMVKTIIECAKIVGADHEKKLIRAVNDHKDTALHEAARCGDKQVVKFLIEQDPDHLYFDNSDGESPLYIAVERLHVEFPPSMLQKRCYYKVVEIMLEHSKTTNYNGPNGRTVLHAAVLHARESSHNDVVKRLLGKWPKLSRQADENGWVPLHLAALRESEDLVDLLLTHDREAAYMRDKKGRTALHLAARSGNELVLDKIIKECPDCSEMVDEKGFNVLHYATTLHYGTNITGQPFYNHVATKIMENKQLSNMMYNEKDDDGNTPLHHLARYAPTWKKNYHHPFLKGHPRLDPMAFNKSNQTVLDVAYDDVSLPPTLNQNIFLRKLQLLGAAFGRRVMKKDVKQKKQGKRHDNELTRIKKEEEKIERRSKRRQTLLVVATLIATVTFAAGFTLPGGTIQDDGGENKGSPILNNNAAFKVFVVTDSLSLVLSASVVFVQIFSSFLEGNEDFSLSDKTLFNTSLILTMLGMLFMVLAFATGTYAVLGHSKGLAIVTLLIALFFFLNFVLLFYLCCKELVPPDEEGEDRKLTVFRLKKSFLSDEDIQLSDSI